MSDDPTQQPAEAPEPAAPSWEAFEQAGITPDQFEKVQQAVSMYDGLQNLDTRSQALGKIINPQYDGQFLRSMVEGEQEPADPWAHLRGGEQPEPEYGYEPEPQGFDPSVLPEVLDPVLQQYGQQIEQRVFAQLNQMAAEQHIKETATSALQSANLPATFASLVEQQIRQQQQLNPTRQAGDIAREAAAALQREIMQYQAAPPANPQPAGQVPSGPAPTLDRAPGNFDELAKEMARRLG